MPNDYKPNPQMPDVGTPEAAKVISCTSRLILIAIFLLELLFGNALSDLETESQVAFYFARCHL